MDGGRRLLRPLADFGATPALALASDAFCLDTDRLDPRPRRADRNGAPARRRHPAMDRLEALAQRRFLGAALVVALFGAVGVYASVRGGSYATFVEDNGAIGDQVARAAGFAIKAVTITGAREMSENEILALADVSPRKSLLFLDVAAIRGRLKAVPLVRDVSVSKLFPNRLLIDVEERQPRALWQKNGVVSVISADGAVIDDLHDARFEALPLVTGDGANAHIADYLALLDAAGELRPRIRAGIYVAGRRWTLKTIGGIEIDLPEKGASDALARLALLEHDSHILEKDILSLDLRMPGRVVARLSVEAGAARADALAKKTKGKGVPT